MYRPEWYQELAKDRSVLQICLDVHMTVTGAFDRDEEYQYNDIKCLQHVIREWKVSMLRESTAFDQKVLELVGVTLAEFALKELDDRKSD